MFSKNSNFNNYIHYRLLVRETIDGGPYSRPKIVARPRFPLHRFEVKMLNNSISNAREYVKPIRYHLILLFEVIP